MTRHDKIAKYGNHVIAASVAIGQISDCGDLIIYLVLTLCYVDQQKNVSRNARCDLSGSSEKHPLGVAAGNKYKNICIITTPCFTIQIEIDQIIR
jgi:hypothetical protein